MRWVVILIAGLAANYTAASENVKTSDSDRKRVAQFFKLVSQTVESLDASASDESRANTTLFLMRIAWHEGAFLKRRVQFGGGPGRSFFQFEPAKAKDGVDYSIRRGLAKKLAVSGGTTAALLMASSRNLALGKPWPGNSLVEQLLGGEKTSVDLFACHLARIALKRVSAAIPTKIHLQAEYWAEHWKIVFDSPSDRTRKVKQFMDNATSLDRLLPNP